MPAVNTKPGLKTPSSQSSDLVLLCGWPGGRSWLPPELSASSDQRPLELGVWLGFHPHCHCSALPCLTTEETGLLVHNSQGL